MEYSVIIYHDPADGMYIGPCKEYPEAFSQGANLDDFIANMKESIELAVKSRRKEFQEEYKGKPTFYRKIAVTA